MFEFKYNVNDMLKGRDIELMNHGIDVSILDSLSNDEERNRFILNRPNRNPREDDYLFSIASKNFLPDENGAFGRNSTGALSTGRSAELAFKLMFMGQGYSVQEQQNTHIKTQATYDYLGMNESITLQKRRSDIVVDEGNGKTVHIEVKVGCPHGNKLKYDYRQELYGDKYRLESDPNTRQIYIICDNKDNGSSHFDERDLCKYTRLQKENNPDRVSVIKLQDGNAVSFNHNELKEIEQRDRGVGVRECINSIKQKRNISQYTRDSKIGNPTRDEFSHASSRRSPSTRTEKLSGERHAVRTASGSNVNWGKIIISIIAVLIVLALIVGVVVLIVKCNLFGIMFSQYELTYELADDETYYVSSCKTTIWALLDNDIHVEIPSSYNSKPVTGIGDRAFYNAYALNESKIKSIEIPNTIEWVGSKAFKDSRITEIYISDLEAWMSIKFEDIESHPMYTYAEWDDIYDDSSEYVNNGNIERKLYLNGVLVTDLVVPESIIEIAPYTFASCNSITSITIHKNVVRIGEGSFFACNKIKSLNIPDNVEEIGAGAFNSCSKLESITVPFIGERKDGNGNTEFAFIFDNWYAKGDSEYDHYTFYSYITIPKSLKTVTITSGTIIGERAFAGAPMETIILPSTIELIADSAFYSCDNLKNIEIPDNVKFINTDAFRDCTSLTEITIPASVIFIAAGAFEGCKNLESISFEYNTLPWYYSQNEIKFLDVSDPSKNVNFFKKWYPKFDAYASWVDSAEYNINYNLNGGTVDKDIPITYIYFSKSNANALEYIESICSSYLPTREGYVFRGWTATEIPKRGGDITLTAHWYRINTITLVYNETRSEIIQFIPGEILYDESQKCEYKYNTITLPDLEDGDDYIFSGWFA